MAGPFKNAGDAMTGFLDQLARDDSDTGLHARNFLLDEGVRQERLESYRASGGAGAHDSFEDWKGRHDAYLTDKIFLPGDSSAPPTQLEADDPDLCPETFRYFHSPYAHSSEQLDLIRLESVASMAHIANVTSGEFHEAARKALDGDVGDLDRLLGLYSREAQLRPVFAAFWEDVRDLFPEEGTTATEGWANELRDRLGLAHHDPASKGDIDVMLFRYPIAQIPRLDELEEDQHPLVPPTVLDGHFSAAFCPAPVGSATGHTIHLSNPDCNRLCREVLHPARRFRAGELMAVGTIDRGVEATLLREARALHIECLRRQREDYGMDVEENAA